MMTRKFSLLAATAAALVLMPGLILTASADAQRRHDRGGSDQDQSSPRGGQDFSRGDRGGYRGGDRGGNRSSPQPDRRPPPSSAPQQPSRPSAPQYQQPANGGQRPSYQADIRSNRGDQWQGRGGQRPPQQVPVMDRIDPGRQPAPVVGGGRPGAPGGYTGGGRPGTPGGYSGGGRPDGHTGGGRPGTPGGYSGGGRPDGHTGGGRPGTPGGYSGGGRPDGHTGGGRPGTPGGYSGGGRPDVHTGGGRPGRPGGYSGGGRPGGNDSHTGGGYRPQPMVGHGGRDNRGWSGGHRGYPAGFRPDPRRRDYADRRHSFYRSDHRNDIRWVHHMNVGWNSSPYYGHYGPSTRWRYNARYYDYGYNNRQFAYYDGACRYERNGNGAAVGALLGAIIGGAAADGDSVGAGILLGAGFGAVLGSAASRLDDCDKVQYQYAMNYAFENGQPYYWGNPYSGVRGSIVIRDTYNYGNSECRWGDAEIYMPDGTYNYDQVRMCRDPYGDWQVARQQ